MIRMGIIGAGKIAGSAGNGYGKAVCDCGERL